MKALEARTFECTKCGFRHVEYTFLSLTIPEGTVIKCVCRSCVFKEQVMAMDTADTEVFRQGELDLIN